MEVKDVGSRPDFLLIKYVPFTSKLNILGLIFRGLGELISQIPFTL